MGNRTFAQSGMTKDDIKEQFNSFKVTVDCSTVKDTDYLNVKIEDGVIQDIQLSNVLPKKDSGYFPISPSTQTKGYLTDETGDLWLERVRTAFLQTFVYNIDLSHDFLVTMLLKSMDEFKESLGETYNRYKGHQLDRIRTRDNLSDTDDIVDVDVINRVFNQDTLEEVVDDFTQYFEDIYAPQFKGLYTQLTYSGVETYLETLKIGKTMSEYEDQLTMSVGYYQRMLALLSDIDDELDRL